MYFESAHEALQLAFACIVPAFQVYILAGNQFGKAEYTSSKAKPLERLVKIAFTDFPHLNGVLNVVLILIAYSLGSYKYNITKLSAAVYVSTILMCGVTFFQARNSLLLTVKSYSRKMYKTNGITKRPAPPDFNPIAQTLKTPFSILGDGLIAHKGIIYSGSSEKKNNKTIDIYYSKKVEQKKQLRPVLIYIHGESALGSEDGPGGPTPLMKYLAQRKGYVVVNLNYTPLNAELETTNADEVRCDMFADRIKECKIALAFIKDIISQYHGRNDFAVIAGSGVGATIASILSVTQNTPPKRYFGPKEIKDCKLKETDLIPLKAAILFSPLLGPRVIGRSFYEIHVQQGTRDLEGKALLPLTTILKDFASQPPTFVIEGGSDVISGTEYIRTFSLFCEQFGTLSGYLEIPTTHYGFETYESMKSDYVSWLLSLFVSFEFKAFEVEN